MRLRRFAPFLFLLLLVLALLHRPLLRGEAFLPADLLGYVAPWESRPGTAPAAWNVLRFDGIAQFYPWRLEAARQVRAGVLPLRNPYQFGAQGGTPLLANSQSAPLYPPNALFSLLPTWQAFGVSAALHLLIAATGTYTFARSLGLARTPSLLSATTFCLSGPVVTWLSLPTFLAVSCWLPWLLRLVRHAHDAAGTRAGRGAALGSGAVAGTLLLAGHLQMAFYALLCGSLYAAWLWRSAHGRVAAAGRFPMLRWLTGAAAAGTLALALAAPQLLPAVELSRVSHRAGGGGAPSWAAYGFYLENALPARNLVTLLAPDFFGHPNEGSYWNTNNYAEWAVYVGVLPLLLASLALCVPRRAAARLPAERTFFALLGGLALLMALGTAANVPFFFGVPGFSQTGSPARALLLVAFSLSVLAGVGLEAARRGLATPRARAFAGGVLLLVVGVGGAANLAARPAQSLVTLAGPGVGEAAVPVLASLLLFAGLPALSRRNAPASGGVVVLVAALDLLRWGMDYNPTSPPEAVYPVTPGIRWLQTHARDALIAPINRDWSLSARPPRGAALPPNALTVYGLHDVGGYDSLFPARAKEQVRVASRGEDPSPPENGNIVFVKSAATARRLGARFVVTAPGAADLRAHEPTLRLVYAGDDLTVYENPSGRNWQPEPRGAGGNTAFRVGLFLGLCGVGVLVTGAAAGGAAGRRKGS